MRTYRYEWWIKKRVAKTFLDDPKLTLGEAADKLGYSRSTLSRIIMECKREFILPRVRKTKWTKDLVKEALDYSERQLQRWHDKLMYGECPNCGETGKDSYLYRKLTEKGYWVNYSICKKCGIPFGHRIEADVGTDFWKHEQEGKLKEFAHLGLFSVTYDAQRNLQLAKQTVKKIEKREYVPADHIKMVMNFLTHKLSEEEPD